MIRPTSETPALAVSPTPIRLKKGREKSVLRRHPWIFSGAVDATREPADNPSPLVEVVDASGQTLGFGLHSTQSQIRIRMMSFGPDRPDLPALLKERLTAAKNARQTLLIETDAVRYVNSEGDFLPGMTLDKYADTLVLQIPTEGMERIREDLIRAVRSVFVEPLLFEKSGSREKGLGDRAEIIYGDGFRPVVQIRTGASRFWVDIEKGQKSGFFLDQRRNIRTLREFLGGGESQKTAHLLDGFCYSGAFGINMAGAFGRVTFLDSSESALELCRKNCADNLRPDKTAAEFVRTDAFQYLRTSCGPFDAVVLDPPSFAKRKSEIEGACRGYKDIFRLAMKALRPEGLLAVFCCSHHINADLFQKVAFAAALDANRQARILSRFSQDADHPISVDHPEGEYLKGLLLRVL